MTRRAHRLAAPIAVALAAGLGCSDIVGGPDGVSALDFTGIPFPAIVTGDTMRDSDGNAAPLRATAYDASGDVIADAAIQYLSLDTGVTIDGNGYLLASRRDGTVRLIASIGGLQSQSRTVTVTRRPDTVSAPTTDVALEYQLPDATSNVSPALALSLRSADTLGGLSPNVTGWLVRWRIIHDGDTLATTDTSLVALWSPSGSRHSLRDTTKTDGTASRRLRVYANLLPLQPDSFIVVAEVKHLGIHVFGSPVRYVVSITPPTI
jgi:hypothetical protein